MKRAGTYLFLFSFLLSSCIFVKREYRRGYYLDLNRRTVSEKIAHEESHPGARKIKVQVAELPHPNNELTITIQSRPENEKKNNTSLNAVKDLSVRSKDVVEDKTEIKKSTGTTKNKRTPDPFSLATVIAFTFLSFIVPSLTMYLVFGKGRLYRIDLWVCISAMFLFLLSRAFLLAQVFTLPVVAMIFLGYAGWIFAILFALFHLYRAFIKRPVEP